VRLRRSVLWVGTAALLAVTFVVVWQRSAAEACGGVERVEDPRNPLMSPALMQQRPDPRRDRLVAAVQKWRPPFGEVLGGVDYYYDQWLRLYGVEGGALAWTKRNAPVTMLAADDLAPVWALRPESNRVAWDASADRFLLASLSDSAPTSLYVADLATGERRWCARLGTTHSEGDPFTTAVQPGGSVLVASGSGSGVGVVRLGPDGDEDWRSTVAGADRADFLGTFGDLVVVGGREEAHLTDGQYPVPSGPALTALDDSGKTVWSHHPGNGTVHVVGVHGGLLVLLEHDGEGARLVALDAEGNQAWTATPPPTALQSTLRGGVVLLKSRDALLGLSADNGRRLWRQQIPPTFTPYGFTLGAMPSLDAGHLLLPTTEDLRILDVRSGRQRSFPMPVDGINTTFWPYQLVATDELIGVVTNTAAVVVKRGQRR
jgi:hypothetical protein